MKTKYIYTIESYEGKKLYEKTTRELTAEEVKTTVKNLNSYNDYTYRRTHFDYSLGIALPSNYTTRYGELKSVHSIWEV